MQEREVCVCQRSCVYLSTFEEEAGAQVELLLNGASPNELMRSSSSRSTAEKSRNACIPRALVLVLYN